MRYSFIVPITLAIAVAFAPFPAAAVKKAPYPEVKVEELAPFQGDASFETMRKKFADVVAKKDLAALATLIDAGFQWTAGGEPAEEFDAARDGVHNFKVAFGFRPHGKDADGPTPVGAQWDLLSSFSVLEYFSMEPQSTVVCGPATVAPVDPAVFDQAITAVDEETAPTEWVYVIDEAALTSTPIGGPPAGMVSLAAMPVVSTHPAGQEPTHVELLLPSGKTGWLPLSSVDFMAVSRLCFEQATPGEWKIVAFDQAE